MTHDGQESQKGSGDSGQRPEGGDESVPRRPSDEAAELSGETTDGEATPTTGENVLSPGRESPEPGPVRPTPRFDWAAVPTPARPVAPDAAGWSPGAEQPEGWWWLPIMIGVTAVVLLGLLGVGGWLMVSDGSAKPAASPATSAPAEPTRTPEPTMGPPTGLPTAAPNSRVVMPMVVGHTLANARQVLDRLGIAYRLMFRKSGSPAGTVVETYPRAGNPVRRGDQVTLLVSDGQTPAPTSPVPTMSSEPPGWLSRLPILFTRAVGGD